MRCAESTRADVYNGTDPCNEHVTVRRDAMEVGSGMRIGTLDMTTGC